MKFSCIDCNIIAALKEPVKTKTLSIGQALWHFLRGHHVIRLWNVDSSIVEVAINEG